MKKNILQSLLALLSFMTTHVHAQECYDEGSLGYEDNCCYDASCCVDDTYFYGKFLGGVNFLQSTKIGRNRATYQTGYLLAGFLGFRACYDVKIEAEYAFRRNTIRSMRFFGEGCGHGGHLETSSYMANLVWNVPLCAWGCTFGNLEPFVGAGIGYDCQHMHSSNARIVFHQKWRHFSWQLMAGLSRLICCNTEVSLEYKFHHGGAHFYNHSIGIGLVYKFGGFW